MSTKTHVSSAERFGRWLAGVWRGYMRRERQVVAWLRAQSVPAGAAVALLWIVKLGVLAILLYAAFWLALLLVFAVAAAWVARNADPNQPQPEWRDGMLGFGLYHPDGSRIDPHDPDEEV